MIPDRVVEVLQGPAFIQAGTRDETLRPVHTFAIGAVVHPDRETVTFFVPESRSVPILANLENNGRVALGFALVSHEAYQLKGTYLSARPGDESDAGVQDAYRSKFLAAVRQTAYPEEIARALTLGFAYRPCVAITFRAEEVFLQTPGPGAGKKMD